MKLVVYTPTVEVFDAYYYGYGRVVSQESMNLNDKDTVCTVIDYDDDKYHAEYQQGRFLSGLYCAELKEGNATQTYR